jgi:hypothetical protein
MKMCIQINFFSLSKILNNKIIKSNKVKMMEGLLSHAIDLSPYE